MPFSVKSVVFKLFINGTLQDTIRKCIHRNHYSSAAFVISLLGIRIISEGIKMSNMGSEEKEWVYREDRFIPVIDANL